MWGGHYILYYPREYITGYNVRGMLIRHEAEPSALLGIETHSEYIISGNVRAYAV